MQSMTVPQIRHFTVPVYEGRAAEEELNRFLRGHQILEVREEFTANGSNSLWCVSVKYAGEYRGEFHKIGSNKNRVDYKEVLEPEAFARFVELRARRKTISENEALPAFAVFTDEELSQIARIKEPQLKDLREIRGIGEKKLARFGSLILGLREEKGDEKGEGSVCNARRCRSANRNRNEPGNRDNNLGFRLVLAPSSREWRDIQFNR
ncbi:MAG: HRDC domain-containing protein [Deltaproteobacteria bacterium]|nr:HRDC domain-containing protein [Deltaproteobacteria bacterium]